MSNWHVNAALAIAALLATYFISTTAGLILFVAIMAIRGIHKAKRKHSDASAGIAMALAEFDQEKERLQRAGGASPDAQNARGPATQDRAAHSQD